MSKLNPLSRRATFHARAGLGSAIAVAAMLSLTSAAQAHSSTPHPFKSASIEWDPGGGGRPAPAKLFVGHDGNSYTHLVGEISTRFRLKAKVKSGHRIYGYGITTGDPDMTNIPGSLIGFQDGTYEKSLDRHGTFTMDAATAVTSGTPGIALNRVQEIVDMCNSAFDTPPDTDRGAGQIQLTVHGVFSRGDWKGMQFISWTGWYPDGAKSRPAYAHTTFPVNVVCLNKNNFRVGQLPENPQLGFDHGKMLIKEAKLFLTTISTGQNSGITLGGCKTLKTTVRFETNQNGPVSFDLHRFPGGMTKHTVQAKFEPDTGKYYARYHKYEAFESTTSVQYMAMSTSPSAGNTGWKGITIHCGGGFTQNPNPNNPDNDIPQGKTLEGDFGIADHGAPKCDRIAKALVTFKSPKPDNIHYSLDCKYQNKSGVLAAQPHPEGGYMAVTLVPLDVTETVNESCTLRTVAPYGPKDHVTRDHQFVCATPAGHGATSDLTPETRDEPNVPAQAGKLQSNAEVERKRLDALKKARAERLKKAAEKRRIEAAKAAAAAKRKREAAKKAAELKRKRAAAIKARKLKAQAEAARKARVKQLKLEAAKKARLRRKPATKRRSSNGGGSSTMMMMRRR